MKLTTQEQKKQWYIDIDRRKKQRASRRPKEENPLRDDKGWFPDAITRSIIPDLRWPGPPTPPPINLNYVKNRFPDLVIYIQARSPNLARRVQNLEVERVSGLHVYMFTTDREDFEWLSGVTPEGVDRWDYFNKLARGCYSSRLTYRILRVDRPAQPVMDRVAFDSAIFHLAGPPIEGSYAEEICVLFEGDVVFSQFSELDDWWEPERSYRGD